MKKNTLTLIFVMICSGFIFVDVVSAEWTARIDVVGEDAGGVRNMSVFIGVKAKAETVESPPPPVEYSVKADLWGIEGTTWNGPFSINIQQEGKSGYLWVIAVNPHGNIMPPSTRTAVIQWDPSLLGQGNFQLKKGYDGAGEVVVSDMKATAKFNITGENASQLFSIVYTPPKQLFSAGDIDHSGLIDLRDAISALRILAGIPTAMVYSDADVNGDHRIGIEEVLYVLQVMAGIRTILSPMIFNFDFSGDNQGWKGGFSDYTTGDESLYALSCDYRLLPESLQNSLQNQKKGIFIIGTNRSDDLFMFIKKRMFGFKPMTRYQLTFTVVFGTNAPSGCIGIGGAPGESVWMKAGAVGYEPLSVVSGNQYVMNMDKGIQANSGKDALVIGNIANSITDCSSMQYTSKSLNNISSPIEAVSDAEGSMWVIVGTDSGFEGATGLYYMGIEIRASAL